MAISNESIEQLITSLLTGTTPSKIKDDVYEVEYSLPSLQQLMKILSDAKTNQDGANGGPFNYAEFKNTY